MLILAITFIVKFLIFICEYFNILPLSKVTVYPLNILEIILYVFIIYTVFFTRYYYNNLKIYLTNIMKYMNERNSKIKCLTFLILICVVLIYIQYSFTKLEVNFIDVGQGDCTFIKTFGKNILIDGGGNNSETFDIGKRIIKPYLLNKRISVIDYIIISHFDTDHYRGLVSVIEEFKVRNVVISMQYIKSKEFEDFIDIVNEKNINVIVVKEGDNIYINDNVFINILFPDGICNINSINNNSIVMKFHYYNFTMLFTGDIELEVEKYLSDKYTNTLKSQVLKVAHHGSKTSTSKMFLDYVEPDISLIGVGEDNNFGHPSKEVITRLEEIKSKIYRTDVEGQVVIKKWRYNNIKIKTLLTN